MEKKYFNNRIEINGLCLTFTADGGTQVTEQPVYDWNCVSEDIFRQATFGKEIVNFDKKKTTHCEKRCGDHKDCTSCLKGTGGEGGWSECRWSTQLNEVLLLLTSYIVFQK